MSESPGSPDSPETQDQTLVLTGEVGDVTLIELLKSMAIRDKETGKLALSHDGVTRTMLIREGKILSATSSSPDERLGEVLVSAGIITPKQYYGAAEKIRPGLMMGRILIEQEAITPEELHDGVRAQVQLIIRSIFQLRQGHYRLVLEPFAAGDLMSLGQTTEEIIFRGILSITAFSRVMDAVGSLDTVYRAAPNQAQILPSVDLREEEHHIMSLVKGKASAGTICEMSYGNHFESLKVLWALGALDLIEPAPPGEETPAPPAGPDLILEQANQIFLAAHDQLALVDIGGANRAFAEALAELMMSHGELQGCEFDSAGTLDPSPILYNLTRARTADPAAACRALVEELLMVISFKARELIGPAGEKAVREAVKANLAILK